MSTSAYATLVGKTLTTDTANVVDFNTVVQTISWQIVPAGAISTGAVTLQVSLDGTTWGSVPTTSLTNLSGATLANPYILATGTQAVICAANVAARFARAIVSTNITGTGASVTVLVAGV
jgi:hypothetical protein